MIISRNISRHVVLPSTTVRDVLKKIDRNEDRIVFCVNQEGIFLGLATDGDIRRWLISSTTANLNRPVGEIINRECLFAQINDSVDRIVALLERVDNPLPLLDSRGCCVAYARKRSPTLVIGDRKIGPGEPAYIIAEIGNNHQGDFSMALQLVNQAVLAGADCAKFQMRDLQSLYHRDERKGQTADDLGTQYTIDLLTRFQLSNDDLFRVFDHCYSQGIQPLCTPWDIPSLEALERYGIPAYKTASADFTNHDLLRAVAECGKPMICSTGMCTDGEVRQGISLLNGCGASFALLHCNSTYPAPFKDINLGYLAQLRTIGSCPVGYSSHDRGINISIAAVTLGASIVEKHFTLDRSLEGNDHRVSLLPGEFGEMVEAIRQVELALGNAERRQVTQGELMNRETLGKSIFVNRDLQKGEVIREDTLVVRSPGRGLQPNRKQEIIGKPALRDLRAGDILFPSDLGELTVRPRTYRFSRAFGIPVRYHDLSILGDKSNFDLLEFHLSYRDMEEELAKFFDKPLDLDLVVHAPELFQGDHILDLCSTDPSYRRRSIELLAHVLEVTRKLRPFFLRSSCPLIVINAGGFTQDKPLAPEQREERYLDIVDALSQLDCSGVEIIPQTMPPFPWHFGGQRYQNLFMDPNETRSFCDRHGFRVCLDVSHSKMACNHYKWSFEEFLRTVGPVTAHLHLADASGPDGEGLQFGEGEIDLASLGRVLRDVAPCASFIPEIWQGHKNEGQGFWQALELLEPHL